MKGEWVMPGSKYFLPLASSCAGGCHGSGHDTRDGGLKIIYNDKLTVCSSLRIFFLYMSMVLPYNKKNKRKSFLTEGKNVLQMEELRSLFAGVFHGGLLQVVFSGPRGEFDGRDVVKVKVRPVELKDGLHFQFELFTKTQAFHENLDAEQAAMRACELGTKFKQAQIATVGEEYSVLVSKKGKVSIRKKRREMPAAGRGEAKMAGTQAAFGREPGGGDDKAENARGQEEALPMVGVTAHDKRKNYILQEGRPVPFLVDLGVMTKDGMIVRPKFDKFRQINRFLEFVEDVLPRLERERELTILDFGCGKSYLTFAMYYYLHELKGYDIRMIGLDLKKDVIARCNRLAEKYGYHKLTFLAGNIAEYEGVGEVDMVVTLHACDTATDYALAKAVGWNAGVILSVPCCQHELNRQIRGGVLSPIMDYGILKERFAALLTDGLRAKYLESMGYETQVLEFIDMEHTPKNILLRAVKSRKMNTAKVKRCGEEIRACEEFLGARPTLGKLFKGERGE